MEARAINISPRQDQSISLRSDLLIRPGRRNKACAPHARARGPLTDTSHIELRELACDARRGEGEKGGDGGGSSQDSEKSRPTW